MSEAPNYSYNPVPRFSANQLSEYLCTRDATQRESVIRKAKFPRKPSLIAYQQITPSIRAFFSTSDRDLSHFDEVLERLEAKAMRESGYPRDEALRCSTAIAAFKSTYSSAPFSKLEFLPSPQDIAFKISGVLVNVRLDPPVLERQGADKIVAGGLVMLFASTPEGRKNIADRRKHVAALAHWGLEETQSNIEAHPRICISFDVFGNEITRTPTSHERLRKTVQASCREIANSWGDVEPPAGYDGPNWR